MLTKIKEVRICAVIEQAHCFVTGTGPRALDLGDDLKRLQDEEVGFRLLHTSPSCSLSIWWSCSSVVILYTLSKADGFVLLGWNIKTFSCFACQVEMGFLECNVVRVADLCPEKSGTVLMPISQLESMFCCLVHPVLHNSHHLPTFHKQFFQHFT